MVDADLRLATVADARDVARLLHAFNAEFDTPTPRAEVLAERLATLVERDDTFAVVAGSPPNAVALVTLRPNVWAGTVALLDELYVEPDARGAGIGARVLALVAEEAARRGATGLEVEVDEPDVDAQRFYDREGLPLADATTGQRAFVVRRSL
ncbi:GNAT family N-acetyltransferase [Agrococcus jejuensis]|uniref:Acetyltransferase (GNAT) domain-containing protein n=1 Tax=Agrococcus jejuensis TaxID=399736 RepID=A0A1G8AG40_9MICO|nr:GNAT family N-acetyltransferase [Agrococcus jejuensis]SDH19806.1 Acetyltransferase (GNAT) domain-containing protein [Agrococcus jejuensis]